MGKRNKTVGKELGLVVIAALVCGTLVGQEAKPASDETGGMTNKAPAASRVTFGSNLHPDPCWPCKYNPNPSGLLVLGPTNCYSPGMVERLAIAFVAQASGVPDRILASLVLYDPANCPSNQVTLSLYTDACYPTGVGTLLASGVATVPDSPCGLAVAKLTGAPALVAGTKYWVTATTGPGQDAFEAEWHSTNDGQTGTNTGGGWSQFTTNTPGFTVRGSAGPPSNLAPASRRAFASNLIVDPCTGCIRDANFFDGYALRGPSGCGDNSTSWFGASFIASFTGTPERLLAAINRNNAGFCLEDKVTLSLYTDNCGLGPGTLLVSGQAKIPNAQCGLAVAKLKNSPQILKGTKYWVTATTNASQATLNASWYLPNNAQICVDLGEGWFQSSIGPPAFAVE